MFDTDEDWIKYKKSLERLGFFNGEVDGTFGYKILEQKAKAKYLSSHKSIQSSRENGYLFVLLFWCRCLVENQVEYAKRIDAILSNVNLEDEYFEASKDDPEDWMRISPSEVDKILGERADQFAQPGEENDESKIEEIDAEENPLHSMAQDIQDFVSKVSSFEGAEFPDDVEDPEKLQKFLQRLTQIQNESEESDDEIEEEGEDENEVEDEEIRKIMTMMDRELASTNISKSFEKSKNDVDEHLNLVKNFLESYASQEGLSGPVSNLLNELAEIKNQNP